MKIDPSVKKRLGFKETDSDREILKILRNKKKTACKPCWELKYCPYGPLVEDFPLLPQTIHPEIHELSCTVFGHLCPVYFVAEPLTETEEERRTGRYIPFETKIRIVRRDNYTCQICDKHLNDSEVEFDHIIPLSKGGSSEEHNIRLTCYDCNRDKSNKVQI